MKIKALGCYGSEAVSKGPDGREIRYRTSGFLIDDELLVDAGTVSDAVDLSMLSRIGRVLVSHIHFDHIKGLPFLADNLFGRIQNPVEILSIEEVLEGLHRHLLNDKVWPDFTRIPDAKSPIFSLRPMREERDHPAGRYKITAVAVNHIVPTVGFIIEDGSRAVLYSGDTHETKRIWEVASKRTNLSAVLIETSFPDDMHGLAVQSGHLTPRLLGQEFAKIGRPDVPLYVYHMKPQYIDQIEREIRALKIPNFTLLSDGMTVNI